jgi:F420-dependent oxidoreductase-like protein
MDPKFGLFVPQGWSMDLVDIADPEEQYEAMTHVAQEAERKGLDSIWVYDHFHTAPTPELETTFEGWISTAALARDTSTIRIGQMVTSNSYRNPALLAKMASTVDVLSHGRLNFGIGAGWYRHEYEAYGYRYPDRPVRAQMLGEALEVIRTMWEEPYASFEGRYYQLHGAINEPKGVQKPHIPIWIGGGGEKVTLKLAAKYAAASNVPGGIDPQLCRHKFEILRQHCETVGRDYDEITRSIGLDIVLLTPGQDPEQASEKFRFGESLEQFRQHSMVATPQEVIEKCHILMEAGVQYFIIYLFGIVHLDVLHHFAEDVLPAFGVSRT